VRSLCQSDLSVAVSGIAGPDGGTPGKPVGTVFCAVASVNGVEVRKFLFSGGRRKIRESAVCGALELLLSVIPE
jgi:PncC family amidohydrolase